MLSDDVYRAQSGATIAELEAWLHSLRAVAHVDIGSDAASWRAAVTPRAAEACPVELVLRQDQRFDIAIAGENHEEQPVESFGLFLPLLHAVAAGDVIVRSLRTGATGAQLDVETIVGRDATTPLPWRRKRILAAGRRLAGDREAVSSERHFAPYARGA